MNLSYTIVPKYTRKSNNPYAKLGLHEQSLLIHVCLIYLVHVISCIYLYKNHC